MILVVDMNFKKGSLAFYEFVLPIISVIRKQRVLVKHHSELSSEDIDDCERIVLSGTALKDNDFLGHVEDFDWIRKCDKPVLGICAGMEVIGLVFGSSLQVCLEIGMKEIRLKKKNALFSSTFKAYELHSHSVQPSEEFDMLAESENCMQAIKHKEKAIYGVLFHPEVRNTEIIERFILVPTSRKHNSASQKQSCS
jgi:GMP synthase-like glutamine amidotransferase